MLYVGLSDSLSIGPVQVDDAPTCCDTSQLPACCTGGLVDALHPTCVGVNANGLWGQPCVLNNGAVWLMTPGGGGSPPCDGSMPTCLQTSVINPPTAVPISAVPGANVETTNPFCPVGQVWSPGIGVCCAPGQITSPIDGSCTSPQVAGFITWPMLAWGALVAGSIGIGALLSRIGRHKRK